jgi:hypothetical protein
MSPALTRRALPGPSRPAVRLRPPPALEPPYDDERAQQGWAGPGATEQLALDWRAHRAAGDRLAVVTPTADALAGASAESWVAVRRFIALCLEIFNGYRPTGHVRLLTSPSEAGNVIEQLALAGERIAGLRRMERAPMRSGPATVGAGRPAASLARVPRPATGATGVGSPRVRRPEAVALRRLRVCEPRRGVAEAAAVLHANGRAWALAVRLEQRRGRWLCTAVRTV